MRTRHFSRRLIGLLAAYLVALPALAMPLSITAAALGEGLCVSEHVGDPAPHPRGHDQNRPCCAGCALLCHAPTLADGGANPLLLPRSRLAAVLTATPHASPPRSAVHLGQMPRGPPVS